MTRADTEHRVTLFSFRRGHSLRVVFHPAGTFLMRVFKKTLAHVHRENFGLIALSEMRPFHCHREIIYAWHLRLLFAYNSAPEAQGGTRYRRFSQ